MRGRVAVVGKMAAGGNNLIRVNVKSQSGADNYVLMDKAIAEWMISEECDPASRHAIIDAACDNNNNKVSYVHLDVPVNATNEHSKHCPEVNNNLLLYCETLKDIGEKNLDYLLCNFCETTIHNWTDNEKKLLINLRGTVDIEFSQSRNYDVLWEEIVYKMNEKNIKVTKLQVMNKWKKMRKKYKEVKDNNLKSCSNPINWKHLDAFDQIFGHKQSSRPTVIIDSGNKMKPVEIEKEKCQENNSDSTVGSDLPGPSRRKRTNCKTSHKDKHLKHIEKLDERQEEVLKKVEDYHNAGMERMDKLLTIFERAVDKKPEHKK